jgi:hypothetical protein
VHTSPLFIKLNILPLPQIIKASYIYIMYHFNLSTNENRARRTGAPTLRNAEEYFTPLTRTDQLARCPLTLARNSGMLCLRILRIQPLLLIFLSNYKLKCQMKSLPHVPGYFALVCASCEK